jgi:hypothetical protein
MLLPSDRLEPSPPLTNVGVDTFGPWQITTRKTRGGSAQSKRWAILFTCLVTRSIHIELVESMSSSAFVNALRVKGGDGSSLSEGRSAIF